MNNLVELLLGKVDPEKQYYTDEMVKNDIPAFLLFMLVKKDIITISEIEELKSEFIQVRNKEIIEEMQAFRDKSKEEHESNEKSET